ncbi:hypothetical protein G7B40_025505 [Aetokthonos hydrillicola Thurmond2011]|jgi:hypothetical protein|uniref:Uncharacterized protein n=1 Tax=Aetokthonos hydrillicola Thurmond2011 TaxID=2712845 RepID=A0AAP5ICT0_9CYAN|nr:hypothetical protein [Aetokthonos hydrillicola]MBO3458386.1 hypothetical protein [Aetokthonos hydrillicola CCALA 1050]MBW4586074.1 hypothetical protein [Aetokthonos hydrillicola CCALA 1050]MDR9897894.1 hypothetical protein [Aetokthonos hydrillicola Thurmond2011]
MKHPIVEKAYGNWRASVYAHPVQPDKFSYTLTLTDQLRLNPEPITPEHLYLFSCFESSQEALLAGIDGIKNSTPK